MTYEQRKRQNQIIRDYANYGIIVLISLVSVIFLPMLTSDITGTFEWPETALGWTIWIATKICVAIINIIIFYCFTNQAKINVRDNERYKEANEKLNALNKQSEYTPRSPKTYQRKQWTTKGITIIITSIASAFVLGESLMRFEKETFFSYLFTIFICVIFSYISMRNNEDYWVSEFPEYVDNLVKEALKETPKLAQNCQSLATSDLEDKTLLDENETQTEQEFGGQNVNI